MNKKIKILHLEDSLKDAELIRSLIESGGIEHEYILAEEKNDFLNFLKTKNIDLILSDYHLPGYYGYEALKVVKENYSHIPFIFVSGAMGEDAAINSLLNGAIDYVLKNKLERLVPAIKRAIHETEIELARIQAENELRESEVQLNEAQSIGKMGSWEWDLVTQKNKWSDNYFVILGLQPSEIEPSFEYFRSKIHLEDVHILDENNAHIRKNKKPISLEFRLLLTDGKIKWIQNNVVPVIEDDKIVKLKGVIIDITERKKAEEELLISEQTYRGILDSISEAVYIQDENGYFLDVNLTSENMYGYKKEYFVGRTPEFLSAPGKNDLSKIAEAVKKAFNGEPQYLEFCGLRKDGTIFPKDVSLTSGKYFGRKVVITIARDITERKQAEEAMRKKDEHHRDVIENIFRFVPEGLLVFARNLNLMKQNKAFEDIVQKNAERLGYTEEELAEKIIEQLRGRIIAGDTTDIHISRKDQ